MVKGISLMLRFRQSHRWPCFRHLPTVSADRCAGVGDTSRKTVAPAGFRALKAVW